MRAVTRTLLALAVAGRISAPAPAAALPSDERHQSKVGSLAPEIFTSRRRAGLPALRRPPGKDSVGNGIAIGAAIGAGTGLALMGWAYAQCDGSCDAPEPLPMYLGAGGFGAAVGGVVGWLIDASRKSTNRRVAVNGFAAAEARARAGQGALVRRSRVREVASSASRHSVLRAGPRAALAWGLAPREDRAPARLLLTTSELLTQLSEPRTRDPPRIPNPEPASPDTTHSIYASPMLNYIWFGLMAVSLVVAAFNGTAEAVTKAAVDSASTAVDHRHRPRRRDDAVARDDADCRGGRAGGHARAGAAAGAAMDVSRGARRAIPPPARSSSPSPRTCSGLNNAATPLGIKAMEELQELNGDKETATNPMVTFMAMTTSGVQLIPSTMIGAAGGGGLDQSHGDHRAGPGGDVHRHGRRGRRRQAAAAVLSGASAPRPRRRAPSDSRRARSHLDLGRAGHARRHRRSPA